MAVETESAESENDGLPSYANLLKSFHREFAPELKALVNQLPLLPGDQVLEVATGDGQFAIWLGEQVGPSGAVTAIDVSQAWLRDAAKRIERSQADVTLEQADATQLPYPDNSFDFVWCAQSLYSLPKIMDCLSEMRRVLKPGGRLAILENDSMHHVLLPWPPALELYIHAAELRAFRSTASQPLKYYSGRWLSRLLRKVGLHDIQERSFASTRQQPLSDDAAEFFQCHLQGLHERIAEHLKPRVLQQLEQRIDPASRRCLWKHRDFVAVCIDRVVWAEK